jgi:hypothetical protein
MRGGNKRGKKEGNKDTKVIKEWIGGIIFTYTFYASRVIENTVARKSLALSWEYYTPDIRSLCTLGHSTVL